jgi:hypothetical protein
MMMCADSGSGGGLVFGMAVDAQGGNQTCYATPHYWVYSHETSVWIEDSVITGNSVACDSCSGGGIAIQNGGNVTISRTIVSNNSAGQFGGGRLRLGLRTDD